VNLPRLDHLKNKHDVIGLSDHTPDVLSSIFAIGWGVAAIEKHFTIDNDLPGRDNKFALLPAAMAQIAEAARRHEEMARDHGMDFQPEEADQRVTYRGRWSGGSRN
jgi:sialic acid synthase SpsE